MPLIDIEKELQKVSQDPQELAKLREAASLGLRAAIEEIERQQTNAKNGGYLPAFIAAQTEALVYLRAMLSRAEKGQRTHPSTLVD